MIIYSIQFFSNGDGILWLHGYENVFEKTLAVGEQMDIEPVAGCTRTRV
jgi:hypothetical protein